MKIYRKKTNVYLVSFSPVNSSKKKGYPFKLGEHLIFLGEIENMPGHCVVAKLKSGKIIVGFHTENFKKLSIDET